jgi:uncharacterized protein YdbL (DUF1318 family)
MRPAVRRFALLAALCLGLAPGVAWALGLDEAKSAGQVGERVDGYVGAVQPDSSGEIRELVKRVNRGRREKYSGIATENGISVEAVAAQAGAKLVRRAPSGQWVMDSDGRWKQK